MEQILLAYGIPKETVAAITILYRNTKVKVRSPDGDTEYFDIVAGVLQGDTLAPYLFIICLDYVLRTSIDKIKENGFELTKKRSRRYPATTFTDADYADDIAILANTPDQAETLLHSLERAAASIGLHVNAHKTEYMCYNQTGDISTLEGTPLKLVDKFTYLGSSVESTEKDIETRLTKAWTAINRLSTIWKSDLTDKMKRSLFQAAVTLILLYGCTTWTLTKRLEKKLDGNYTRMLRAILNKSWQQHPTRHQLYGHLPPITKTIQVRRTRHAGLCWRSRDELIRDVLLWIPTNGRAKAAMYIQQLCEDTGCCPEDLPRAMNDREEWRERVRDIRAARTIWWWWWFGLVEFYGISTLVCYLMPNSFYTGIRYITKLWYTSTGMYRKRSLSVSVIQNQTHSLCCLRLAWSGPEVLTTNMLRLLPFWTLEKKRGNVATPERFVGNCSLKQPIRNRCWYICLYISRVIIIPNTSRKDQTLDLQTVTATVRASEEYCERGGKFRLPIVAFVHPPSCMLFKKYICLFIFILLWHGSFPFVHS